MHQEQYHWAVNHHIVDTFGSEESARRTLEASVEKDGLVHVTFRNNLYKVQPSEITIIAESELPKKTK